MPRRVTEVTRGLVWIVTATLLATAAAGTLRAQRNGEASSHVPVVEKTDYDMRAFAAPLRLTPTEARGRVLFAQRCANCHGGAPPRAPGPLLWKDTVDRRGEEFVRDKIRKGTPAIMPGFEYSLQPAQIDQIDAFLKVAPEPRRSAGGGGED
jgi:mono/diheme cytochrome c family protein